MLYIELVYLMQGNVKAYTNILKLHFKDLYYYGYNTIVRNVMAYNIYHIYITNTKDNGVIESVHIRLTNLYLNQIGANT
jgi:hypothetical protein